MFTHTRDDRNMDFRVAGVPERVESPRPGCDCPGEGEEDERGEGYEEDTDEEDAKEEGKLFCREEGADELGECDELEETEYSEGGHMFGGAYGHEPDKWDLH